MPAAFQGFPEEALSFLKALARNNRREWFQPRKAVYETRVRAPMAELVDAVNRALARFAPDYINAPEKAIYRIYRDTRFSPDKTPYKTHIAAIFPRRGLEKHRCAGLYFGLSARELDIAGGVYMPDRDQLLALRTHLAEHHERFRKLASARKLTALMGPMQGERLERLPKGFSPGHPARDLVQYRQWLWDAVLDPAVALTPRIYDEIVSRFRAMAPVVEFLNEPFVAALARPAAVKFLE